MKIMTLILYAECLILFWFSTQLAGEDGGIIKEIITPGTGWEKPEKGDKVTGKLAMLIYVLCYKRYFILSIEILGDLITPLNLQSTILAPWSMAPNLTPPVTVVTPSPSPLAKAPSSKDGTSV